MKKVMFLLSLCIAVSNAFAQKKFISKASNNIALKDFSKAKEFIDSALKYDINKSDASFWMVMGDFYLEVARNRKTEFYNDKNPWLEAFYNYEKAQKLDTLNKLKKKIGPNLDPDNIDPINKPLYIVFRDSAAKCFERQDYENAYNYLNSCLTITRMPYFKPKVDTVVLLYTGVTANLSKKYSRALELLSQMKDYNYQCEDVYRGIKDAYLGLKDTIKAFEILKTGMVKCQPNTSVIFDLVNLYLITGISPQDALNYLRLAQEKEPENATLYFAEGNLFEKLNQPDSAINSYLKAVGKDPKFYYAYLNVGAIYYNKGVEIFSVANNLPIKEQAKADKMMEEVNVQFKLALPYLEKAYEINSSSEDCLRSLKEIYYRLKMNDKYKMVKEKLEAISTK